MDNNKATSTLMLRIQGLDPENASKIMGYILIQDPGEKEMIRLALGPDALLINLINQAKTQLGILSNTSSAPSSPSVFNPPRRNLFAQTSPRIIPPTSPWSTFSPKPPMVSSPSYASAVINGSSSFDSNDEFTNAQELLFDTKGSNFMDSVSPRSEFPFDEYNDTHRHHRRSFSVSDVYQQDDDYNDGGWRPCMYFARGFCKNGNNCKFIHDDSAFLNSPKIEELLRYKALQQQRFAAASQLLAEEGASFPYNRSAATALMMGEEYHKFGRCRPDMNAFGFGGIPNSSARQIYLTFPADSTFKEEDVSRYFGTYGPVQDVRIPYQQKRMFGFVTFVYPETVKQILAHGNPHFVCDSRVLVKPYKEKGKLPDKKQHLDRGEFLECLSPSGHDLTEPFDLPFGGRVIYNSHEMMLRRKIQEQTDIEQAIECHGRRLMNFQLLDMPSHHPNHQLRSHLVAAVSPQTHGCIDQNFVFPSDNFSQEYLQVSNGGNDEDDSPTTENGPKILEEVNESGIVNISNGVDSDKEEHPNLENYGHQGSLEHILPDNLFASPTKPTCESLFYAASAELDTGIPITSSPLSSSNIPVLPVTSTLSLASPKPCYVDMPR